LFFEGLRWNGIADNGASLTSRLMPAKSAESVADRFRDGVTRSVVFLIVSVATLANDRRDFFASGSFGSPDLREVTGGFMAFRFGGDV
jgi:flagellar biosynthesis/type III secretory pathway ATPase